MMEHDLLYTVCIPTFFLFLSLLPTFCLVVQDGMEAGCLDDYLVAFETGKKIQHEIQYHTVQHCQCSC